MPEVAPAATPVAYIPPGMESLSLEAAFIVYSQFCRPLPFG